SDNSRVVVSASPTIARAGRAIQDAGAVVKTANVVGGTAALTGQRLLHGVIILHTAVASPNRYCSKASAVRKVHVYQQVVIRIRTRELAFSAGTGIGERVAIEADR